MVKFLFISFAFSLFVLGGAIGNLAQRMHEMNVKIGETGNAAPKLAISFVKVLEDSRCPEGTTCVWAGRAVIRVKVQSDGGEPREFDLEAENETSMATVGDVTIRLAALTPHPISGQEIDPKSYTAKLIVEQPGNVVCKE